MGCLVRRIVGWRWKRDHVDIVLFVGHSVISLVPATLTVQEWRNIVLVSIPKTIGDVCVDAAKVSSPKQQVEHSPSLRSKLPYLYISTSNIDVSDKVQRHG